MKRHTRKQWYDYHLKQAQLSACASVTAHYAPLFAAAEQHVRLARGELISARSCEPWFSRLIGLMGFSTKYRSQIVFPLEVRLREQESVLSALRQNENVDLHDASKRGADEYRVAHELRKKEAAARAERVIERKKERRVRYLERSPAIRSAARFFRRLLILQYARDGEYVTCFYCGASVLATESHLEHKRPVSRGGDNRRSNLVLACPACNLKKGRKTHEEFLRAREKNT